MNSWPLCAQLNGKSVPGGGGPICHEASSGCSKSLNSSVVAPSVRRQSSTQAPRPSVLQSVIALIRMSTRFPAYADRSTVQSFQPLDDPVNACHSPVVPVGSQPSGSAALGVQ